MKKRHLIVMLIAGIVIVMMSAIYFGESLKRGEVAPLFTLKNVSGNAIALENYRGKIVLLHFWAKWCPVCLSELPDIERLRSKFDDNKLVILSVLVDETEMGRLDTLPFPVLLDTDGTVSDAYHVRGVPESFIVGRDGLILDHFSGKVEWNSEKYTDYFQRLLKS